MLIWLTVFLGTVESNPQVEEAVCLTISFHKYNLDGPIYYPPFDKVSFLRSCCLHTGPSTENSACIQTTSI